MALITAAVTPSGVTLTDRRGDRIEVAHPSPATAPEFVTVWRDRVAALPAAEATHAWLSRALDVACRLVHLSDTAARPIDPVFADSGADAGTTVSFADGFPLLLASLGSLDDLNARLARPIPIGRFRPNLVVAGAPPWEEDSWRLIRIGAVVLRVVKPCDRCVVTTIDPATGERPDGDEPLRTLRRFRRDVNGRVMFGQNLIPRTRGRIHIGDAVEVLERGPPNVHLRAGSERSSS
jgi:uncharacterized protein YcbX